VAIPNQLIMKPVYWAPAIQGDENELWNRLQQGGPMDFVKLRRFIIDFVADGIAYQPVEDGTATYEAIHPEVTKRIAQLAEGAGPKAPLCIIAHSLGTVVASNYLYDLQADPRKRLIKPTVRKAMGKTYCDKGETFAAFYTLGSPIALWSLRYRDFGKPIQVPD